MASEIQTDGPFTAFQPSTTNIARRSVSIFSRKGTETPTQLAQVVPLSSLDLASGLTVTSPTSVTSSATKTKSKRWTLTGRVEGKLSEGGTILRAVPKDAPSKMTMSSLEREMATSPNDEIILRAFGRRTDSAPTSPVGSSSPLTDITNISPQRYYSKRTKKDQQDVLGVWQNGQVRWDRAKPRRSSTTERPKTANETQRSSLAGEQKHGKPKIQVIIPENYSGRRPFAFRPFFSPPIVDRTTLISSSAVAPSLTSSGIMVENTLTIAVSPPESSSVVDQHLFKPITTAIDKTPAFEDSLLVERFSHSRTKSLNSNSSDSEGEENGSTSQSSRSSMTSIGLHNDEHADIKAVSHDRRDSRSSFASYSRNDDAGGLDKIVVDCESEVQQVPRMADMIGIMRAPSIDAQSRGDRIKRLSSSRGQKLLARINSKEDLKLHGAETPTLAEAVHDLEESLISLTSEQDGADAPEVLQLTLSPVPGQEFHSFDLPPAVPRKSSKRARVARTAETPSQPSAPTGRDIVPMPRISPEVSGAIEASRRAHQQRRHDQLQRRHQLLVSRHDTYSKLRRRSSVRSVLSLVDEEGPEEPMPVNSASAEHVVLCILTSLQTMDDVFNAALITRGFYHIFKRNQPAIMRQALLNQSPPAWELRESILMVNFEDDDSAVPAPEYTPDNYYQGCKADTATIASVKALVFRHCPSLLRGETYTAMRDGDSTRVDAAFCRIWTFCQIFGSNKGREEDIAAQMDWLRGGVLAHQASCSSTISTHDSFYLSNVLLNVPEHFARGNGKGLSAEDLFDMMELWSCLTKLTKGVLGQTDQARQFGVFDNTDIGGGDIDGEELMLEEWHAYILTLGLPAIVELATALADNDTHTAFATAQNNGLTDWSVPTEGSSRSTFLHEAVSRLYEERICEAFSSEQSQMKEMRSIRRARDTEYRQRRLSVRSARQVEDRRVALSREWGSFRSSLSSNAHSMSSSPSIVATPPAHYQASSYGPVPSRCPPALPQTRAASAVSKQSSRQSSSARNSYFPYTEPIAEELPPYNKYAEREAERQRRHPTQQIVDANPGLNSSEKAVFRIVEMGFTPDEAKGALKITDMGDGLRVDRAVEYLMRSKGFH